jgi:hypothetical protein
MDNEELAELEPMTRLLFIYLWMLADRRGRLEDRPKRIAAQALPYDRTADVGAMLDDLHRAGFIVRYVAESVACIQILAFEAHQSPHVREADSALPAMGNGTAKEMPKPDLGSAETSPRSPDTGFLIPDSLIADKAAPAAPTPPRSKTLRARAKTSMPDDFGLSERVVRWAQEGGYARLPEHLEAFKRKALAKSYTYADWDSALMEAIREDWAKLRGAKPVPAGERATAVSSDAERTQEYLRAHDLTPEERARSEEARKRVMSAVKVINKEAA